MEVSRRYMTADYANKSSSFVYAFECNLCHVNNNHLPNQPTSLPNDDLIAQHPYINVRLLIDCKPLVVTRVDTEV